MKTHLPKKGLFLLTAISLWATVPLWADNPPVFCFSIEPSSVPDGSLIPNGLALDSNRNLYVLDGASNRVVKFDANGRYLLQWTAGGIGIAADTLNNVYLVGGLNPAIVSKYTSAGVFLANWAGTPSNPPSFFAPFNATSIATDSGNNVYVSSQAFSGFGAIVLWKMSSIGSLLGSTNLQAPTWSVALDGNNNVYALELPNQTVKLANNFTFETQWTGPFAAKAGQFLASDKSNHVYVADLANSQIQKFTTNGTLLTQWGTAGTGSGQFSGITAVAVDRTANYIYVADTNHIQVFTYLPVGTPIVSTRSASSITSTSATLRASINSSNLPTTAWFEWGTTTNYGNVSGTTNLDPGASLGLLRTVAGLGPGTTYHYTGFASNSLGLTVGSDTNFTTPDVLRRITNVVMSSPGQFQMQFLGGPDVSYTILRSTNLAAPITNWTVLGPAIQTSPGLFQFTDPAATNGQGFYLLRSP